MRSDLGPWSDLVLDGPPPDVPSLLLEDFSDIPFLVGVPGIEWYQLRSRTRAKDGDVFVSTQRPVDGYEEYNRTALNLGEPRFLHANVPGADPLCVGGTCLEDAKVMKELCRLADAGGGLLVHPYMGCRSVWELSRARQEKTKSEVIVLSPVPPAVFAANHKGLLMQAVTAMMGEEAVCRTVSSNDLGALARSARGFFDRFPLVGLKIANYASGMGNKVYDHAELCAGSVEDIEARLAAFAGDHAWDGKVDILLTEWRQDVLQSPSTQLWIPPLGEAPRVDGVFEQILDGNKCVFQGSMPSTLPAALQEEMSRMSRDAARVLQALGYVGRCSFDFILCGEDEAGARPLFVECNGRWGGTSIPMSLCERISGEGRTPFYRARDYIDPSLKGIVFNDFLKRLGDSVYDVRTGKGHFILYNVGCLRDFGKFDVIALGKDREEASQRLEEELPRRLGGIL